MERGLGRELQRQLMRALARPTESARTRRHHSRTSNRRGENMYLESNADFPASEAPERARWAGDGALVAFAVVLVVGGAYGLAHFANAPPAIEKSLVTIAGSLFTYFLIHRHARRRERAVDARLIVTVASMRRRTRKYFAGPSSTHPVEAEILSVYQNCASRAEETYAFSITRAALGDWIRRHIQLASYIRAALHRVEQLRESASFGTALASNASPRVGTAFVDLAADLESSTRAAVWHMHRGLRGWDRLLVLMSAVPPEVDARAEISEAICAIAGGLVQMHLVVPEIAEDFLTEDISEFRRRLPKRAKAALDLEIAARDADDDAAPMVEDAESGEAGPRDHRQPDRHAREESVDGSS